MKYLLCLLAVLLSGDCYQDRKILVTRFGDKTSKTSNELEYVRSRIEKQCLNDLYELPDNVKQALINQANNVLQTRWDAKLASEYISYFQTGQRFDFDSKVHRLYTRLSWLLVGQLLEQEQNPKSLKYMSHLIDGLWLTLEESTWVLPSHIRSLQKTRDILPIPEMNPIDLRVAENAVTIAWIKFLLQAQFNRISPIINRRIDYELNKRVFEPFMQQNFYWMGFDNNSSVNNWNIWINGHVMKSAMLVLQDLRLFSQIANKTVYSVDKFLNTYGDDGGCKEGPAYWREAGGRLIDYIQTLIYLYNQREFFEQNKLIKNIGNYIYKMHISENWFVNFADSTPKLSFPPGLIAMYGLLFDDSKMKQFAAYMFQFHNKNKYYFTVIGNNINEFWNFIQNRYLVEDLPPKAPTFDYWWLPDVQVLTSRSRSKFNKTLFFAAKFGNNYESHNHNDVGSFILYQNGLPVFIDIGVGTYNSTFFSKNRYQIFYFQSAYHNCPTINGIQQNFGQQFSSKNVYFKASDNNNIVKLSGDISSVYPKNAHVKTWIRTFYFDRISNVMEIIDRYRLDRFIQPLQLHFMTTNQMKYMKRQYGLLIQVKSNRIRMEFDWDVFSLQVQDKSLDNDTRLTNIWGHSVRRLTLVTRDQYNLRDGQFLIRFRSF